MNPVQSMQKDKLWTFHFIKIMFVGLSISICFNMQMATLPIFAQHIGGNKYAAGLMMGIFTLSALLFRPLFGNLLDTKGRKIILVFGVIVFALASLSYNFVYVIWVLFFIRFVHGMGFSAYSTAAGTIVSDIVPTSRLMEGIGYYGIANILATAIGPALGLYLTASANYNIMFTTTFVISIVGLIFAVFINYKRKDKQRQTDKPETDADIAADIDMNAVKPLKRNALFEKTAIPASLVMFFLAMAQGSVTSFLPSYATARGVKDIGIFFTIYAVALMITRPSVGRLSDRFGVTRLIIPGMAALVISLIMMAFSASLRMFLIIAILYGIGYGIAMPILNALTIKMCPQDRRGVGNATFYSSLDAGYGIGSISWGILSEHLGYQSIYIASAGCIVVSMILYFKVLRARINNT